LRDAISNINYYSNKISVDLTKMKFEPAIIDDKTFGFRVSFSGYFNKTAGASDIIDGFTGHITASRWFKTPKDCRSITDIPRPYYGVSNTNSSVLFWNYVNYMKKTRKLIWHPDATGLQRKLTLAKWIMLTKAP
jgi:hypothetical protein